MRPANPARFASAPSSPPAPRSPAKHRKTPTLGRTLLQPATPLALGQKIAGWASDVSRAARRLEASFAETQIVQFGGASGSLSALGDKAEPVMVSIAKRLGLALPPPPWFTQRVRVAALAKDAELVVGALAKAALLGYSPKFVDRLLGELRRK